MLIMLTILFFICKKKIEGKRNDAAHQNIIKPFKKWVPVFKSILPFVATNKRI